MGEIEGGGAGLPAQPFLALGKPASLSGHLPSPLPLTSVPFLGANHCLKPILKPRATHSCGVLSCFEYEPYVVSCGAAHMRSKFLAFEWLHPSGSCQYRQGTPAEGIVWTPWSSLINTHEVPSAQNG